MHRIARPELRTAAATLIAAFADDEFARRLTLSSRMINRMYTAPVEIGLRYGEVYATSEACEGVMAFCHGGIANLSLWDMLRGGLLGTALGLVGLMAHRDMRRLYATVEQHRRALQIGPYLYLMCIGVLPEQQGKGYGRQLLEYLCARADREGRAVYLETQTEANVRWYEKFGFVVIRQVACSEWLRVWELARLAQRHRGPARPVVPKHG